MGEFAGKIRAAKKAQRDPDFIVIARTEALIAGLGMDEALRRGHAYAEAGADMVLIHSKSDSPEEVITFAERWQMPTPLVCVPTTYHTASADELFEAGFRMVIFANHGIRSAIKGTPGNISRIASNGPGFRPCRPDRADERDLSADGRRRSAGKRGRVSYS